MTLLRVRTRVAILLGVTAGGLAVAGSAFAHANVSPAVVLAKNAQVFALAVPTEKENAFTTQVELTPPSGFSIDSFAPAPGWKRRGSRRPVPGRRPSSRRSPGPEARSRPVRTPSSSSSPRPTLRRRTPSRCGRPTPTGRWSTGQDQSQLDTPAPSIEARSLARWRRRKQHARDRRARARRGRARRRGGKPRRAFGEALAGVTSTRAHRACARGGRGGARASRGRLGARGARAHVACAELSREPAAAGRASDLLGGGRAAFRNRLGDRRRGTAADRRARRGDPQPDPKTLVVPLAPSVRRAGTSSTGA